MEKPKIPDRPSEIDFEFALDEFTEIRKQIERAAYPGNRHERRKAMAKDRRK